MASTLKIDELDKHYTPNPNRTKFTYDEWQYNNRLRFCCSEAQQALARKILAKSDNVCEFATENIKNKRDETNSCLDKKINEIECYKEELLCNRNDLNVKIDEFLIIKYRLTESLNLLRTNAMDICKKCLSARERRLGIDLVNDNVEKELRQECDKIKCADELMSQMLEKIQEQIRRMKATLYSVDHDIKNKETNLLIDRHNVTLKETTPNLSYYQGKMPLHVSQLTAAEWKQRTKKNINSAVQELNSAKLLSTQADNVLKTVLSNLINQKNATDEAFKNRIKETKEVKEKLEIKHSEIFQQTHDMHEKVIELHKTIGEKEKFIALNHTRLGNRCQRPNLERCYDNVENCLFNELNNLKNNVSELQKTLFEAQASLRFLLKMQIQLEEDINIKVNSLKIDEVYCLTLHQNIDYRVF